MKIGLGLRYEIQALHTVVPGNLTCRGRDTTNLREAPETDFLTIKKLVT